MKKYMHSMLAGGVLMMAAVATQAQTTLITESPTLIRFEQYTGPSGQIAFWRMPTPGVSTFPNSACKSLSIPADKVEHASRFMALYLFAKSNSKNVFYQYNTSTCVIVSFGMDG